MPSPSKLRCELCGDIIEAPDWVNAVEVVTERDAMGTIVAVRDGYQVAFHEVCWRQQRSRRTPNRKYRRPRRQGVHSPVDP